MRVARIVFMFNLRGKFRGCFAMVRTIRDSGQAQRAAKFLPRQGVARERRRAPLLVTSASNASLSTPEARGGGVDGVAG